MTTLSALYTLLKNHCSDREARWLLEARLSVAWHDIMNKPEYIVSEADIAQIDKDIARIKAQEPISRIIGTREFWGLPFALSPDTLDPRPDSEVLIEAAITEFQHKPPQTILDMGTGTGCLLIALLHEFKDSQGIGVDISENACQTALKNAKLNHVDTRAQFIRSHWFERVSGVFDCIIANPPYIRTDVIASLDSAVKNYDPILALDGGQDGLTPYKILFSALSSFLAKNGRAFFEFGYDQADDILVLAHQYHLTVHRVIPDYAGRTRGVVISCGDK